jgi:hypothetical protein
LEEKFAKGGEMMIRRDIVFCSSLYLLLAAVAAVSTIIMDACWSVQGGRVGGGSSLGRQKIIVLGSLCFGGFLKFRGNVGSHPEWQ